MRSLHRGIPWRSNTSDDALAVERHVAFRIGVFSDPLYTTGDWPKIMTDTLPPDYLPRFTEQEKKDNLGMSRVELRFYPIHRLQPSEY
jgi:beta-glucosidase